MLGRQWTIREGSGEGNVPHQEGKHTPTPRDMHAGGGAITGLVRGQSVRNPSTMNLLPVCALRSTPAASLLGPVLADSSFETLDGPVSYLQGFVNVTCFIS